MYSEHVVATLLRFTVDHFDTGADLDKELGRPVVQVGGVIGSLLGCDPNDGNLAWWAGKVGTVVPAETRAAIHVLTSNRVGLGLGPGRGVVESTGDHLATVHHPEPGRYIGVYRVPTIQYAGLL